MERVIAAVPPKQPDPVPVILWIFLRSHDLTVDLFGARSNLVSEDRNGAKGFTSP